MKLSLALGPRKPLSRQMAWGCLTTNLAMPGFGSLLAGRTVGYAQAFFTVLGFGVSLISTIQTLIWYAANWTRWQQLQETQPEEALLQMWIHLRWPLLGMSLFFFALVWALATSMSIRAESRISEAMAPRSLPPKLR